MKRILLALLLGTLVALSAYYAGLWQGNQSTIQQGGHTEPEVNTQPYLKEIAGLESQVKHLKSNLNYNDVQYELLSQRYATSEKERGEMSFRVSVYKAMTGVEILVSSELAK